ncbi:MAG TPA: prephenate dehydrogenase/arogenate dehydrogenase family protein [Chthoniobacteraceae bacterium]|nr:prephenate dehydrogenase/arogenate dehydrogenase family protein [Chthoniobacteraceae bacterium]
MPFSSIAILSPGLLGGSLALAVRQRMPGVRIRVWARSEKGAQTALARGAADIAGTDVEEIARGADLIVFCMPIGAMPGVAERIAAVVGPETLITDVGSVKEPVVEKLGAIFRGRAQFIGSHPMAGSEQTGIDAARADLFEGAVAFVTPEQGARRETVSAMASFWETMGCRVSITNPRAHDDAVAVVSHLPHLAAAVLVQTAMQENPASLEWRGNGFLDTTRVASGPAPMWTEILLQNREPVKKAIHAMIENLAAVSKLLDAADAEQIEHYLAGAGETRNRLKSKCP